MKNALISISFFALALGFIFVPSTNQANAASCPSGGTLTLQGSNSVSWTGHENASYACSYSDGNGGTLITFVNADGTTQTGGGASIVPSRLGSIQIMNDQQGNTTATDHPLNSSGSCGVLAFVTFDFSACIWRPLLAAIGSLFLFLGAAFLRLAGYIFDLLIWNVVIGFGSWVGAGTPISSAITLGWTVFRDLANIVIIGSFVFISISLILGLREFGQKRLIANVLIIAVLLNFSLLFTKMVIDFSNFTAYQFYAAAADPKITSTDPTTGQTKFDIASAFLAPMGITSIWHVGSLTANVADASGSGWTGLFYGLFGGMMLTWIAVILLYGSYLIIVRGILFLVLMFTSAGAFATFLVPQLSGGKFGFSAWWKALLNAAIFAPLLMLFLLVSLRLTNAISPQRGQIALSAFFDPTLAASPALTPGSAFSGAWGSIFNFIVISGLLFASFKIASKIASSMPGSGALGSIASAAMAAGRVGVAVATGNPLALRLRSNMAESSAARNEVKARGNFSASDKAASQADDLRKAGYTKEANTAQGGAERLGAQGRYFSNRANIARGAILPNAGLEQKIGGAIQREVFGGGSATTSTAAASTQSGLSLKESHKELNAAKEQLASKNAGYAETQQSFQQGIQQMATILEKHASDEAGKPVQINPQSLRDALEPHTDAAASAGRAMNNDEIKEIIQATMGGSGLSKDQVTAVEKRIASSSSEMSAARHRIDEAHAKAMEWESKDPGILKAKEKIAQLKIAIDVPVSPQIPNAAQPANIIANTPSANFGELVDAFRKQQANLQGQERVTLNIRNAVLNLQSSNALQNPDNVNERSNSAPKDANVPFQAPAPPSNQSVNATFKPVDLGGTSGNTGNKIP